MQNQVLVCQSIYIIGLNKCAKVPQLCHLEPLKLESRSKR